MPLSAPPSVREMIATRTLASEIMARHNDIPDNQILDDENIALLRRFCTDPKAPHDNDARQELLADVGMQDRLTKAPDTGANVWHGSLSGYVIATHGTQNAAMDDNEVAELRKWFEGGMH